MRVLNLAISAATLFVAACTADAETSPGRSTPTPETEMGSASSGEGVANLPYARGRVFHSLDEYLAYLEQQGAIDLPWWRETSPGVYEHVRRVTGARREVATRAELMERFGFTR
ncbi:hypothetical protein [Sphingosinicella terrae]|uniref:hypothetical protein n=1 Tax=Sphingosinicella terrae TaxID=2172047 RepID=UPI000E0E05A2|nr:hypothetical protein [Sphingosinicella terrae]